MADKQTHVKGSIFRNSKTKIPQIQHAPLVFHIQNLSMAKANSRQACYKDTHRAARTEKDAVRSVSLTSRWD